MVKRSVRLVDPCSGESTNAIREHNNFLFLKKTALVIQNIGRFCFVLFIRPTDLFTNSELQNPLHDVSGLHRIH